MELIFRSRYTFVRGKLRAAPEAGADEFCIDVGGPVTVRLIDDTSLEAVCRREVSDSLYDALQVGAADYDKWPTELSEEYQRIAASMVGASRIVTFALKYYLDHHRLSESLAAHIPKQWSVDNQEWRSCPSSVHFADEHFQSYPSLTPETRPELEAYLSEGKQLLIHSLRQLHRAKNESEPRYKWIDATIAAELAIKEFLLRIRPDLQSLLLEMPSPPLHKLYGIVLESFTGERSPRIRQLQKGAETRNRLIHRPDEMAISQHEARNYVTDIEVAILHLHILLYPEDPMFRRLYSMRSE